MFLNYWCFTPRCLSTISYANGQDARVRANSLCECVGFDYSPMGYWLEEEAEDEESRLDAVLKFQMNKIKKAAFFRGPQ